jgi:hypothetical protein
MSETGSFMSIGIMTGTMTRCCCDNQPFRGSTQQGSSSAAGFQQA